jgi:hypothetical protein
MLHDLDPSAAVVAFLINPASPLTEVEMTLSQTTATSLGLRLQVVNAAFEDQFEEAFTQIAKSGAGALLISGDAPFLNYRTRLVALVSRTAIPAIPIVRSHR